MSGDDTRTIGRGAFTRLVAGLVLAAVMFSGARATDLGNTNADLRASDGLEAFLAPVTRVSAALSGMRRFSSSQKLSSLQSSGLSDSEHWM